MDTIVDFISNGILAFKTVTGTETGSLLVKIGSILAIAVPLSIFILSIVYLFNSRLEKPQLTKRQQIETLRRRVDRIGTQFENRALRKFKHYSQFEKTVKLADHPWGLSAKEWVVVMTSTAILMLFIVILQFLFDLMVTKTPSFPLFSLFFWPGISVFIMSTYIKSKAKKRGKIIQYDFMRAFNRLGDLEKETSHRMIEIALAGTRILKKYTPRIDVFKNNPKEAMEKFADDIGTDEAILFKNTVLYIMNNPQNKEAQILRAELGIQKARSADEQKDLKVLDTGFNMLLFGPFTVAAGALILPWYQFFKQQIGQFIGF
ncbi:hypothetical protein [Brevibacillus reuszeri]|uniref:hypothetical protein n=1 Tax=Brevibacillus reuszeri TaxID=54915 RepID=UPI000CCC44D8|nr:hypothetical protein [Brevibacillus reuszeri]